MNLIEKLLARKEIFKGKIIHVHHDEIELPNGKKGLREVVDHPGGVMVAPLDEAGNLIFVSQFRYPFGEVLLELPAGKLEKGESPKEAGLRELSEEAGCTAETVVSLGEIYPTVAYCSEIIYLFAATGLSYGETHLDEDEFVETSRIPLETAVEMVMDNRIRDAKTVAGILKIDYMKKNGLL